MKRPERAEERVVAGKPPGAADTARDRLPRPRLLTCCKQNKCTRF